MNQGNSSLNASSLIDLKAELHKKYESFRNVKLKQAAPQSSKGTHFKIKGEIIKEKKNKTNVTQSKEVEPEEDLALKKSREALEGKAKLYEKIMTNKILIDEEQKECYLVDFQRKVLYSSTEPTVENNEKKSFSKVAFTENKFNTNEDFESTSVSKQTTKISDVEDPNQPIHYQNVQFNEIRDHGTGYFAFSTNESKRKEQMEELKTLRQETEEERIKHQKIHMKRNAMLQARLKKICERKNIDPSVLESFNKNPETGNIEVPQDNIDIASIPLPETIANPEFKSANEVKLPKIRPWDIGKDNFQQFIPAKKIRSQEQWVEEKREERPGEFAPPSTYL